MIHDGFSEFISVAAYISTSTGTVYIQPGASTTPTSGNAETLITRRLTGSTTNGRFGAAIGFSDVNGDGYIDFLTSANILSSNNGVAYIFINNKTNSYFTGNFANDAGTIITNPNAWRLGYNIGY